MPSMPTTTIPSHVDPALYSKASEFGTSSEQSDDDWEYEYEENETKVTAQFSSPDPGQLH